MSAQIRIIYLFIFAQLDLASGIFRSDRKNQDLTLLLNMSLEELTDRYEEIMSATNLGQRQLYITPNFKTLA